MIKVGQVKMVCKLITKRYCRLEYYQLYEIVRYGLMGVNYSPEWHPITKEKFKKIVRLKDRHKVSIVTEVLDES